jgi:chloramphenicol-sensitive protein RarD
VGLDGAQSLAIETAFLVLPALGYLGYLEATGNGTFTTGGPGHAALLVGGGIATAVPLVLFGVAAIRVPLTTLGLLQYLAPVMQFLIGVLVRGESMPPSRLAGFVLVWIALAVFTVDAIRALRRPLSPLPARSAPSATPAR